jgi:hypothetical protein
LVVAADQRLTWEEELVAADTAYAVAPTSVTGDPNLKNTQPPSAVATGVVVPDVAVQVGRSETLMVTLVPVTNDPPWVSSTVMVPVGDAAREAIFTPMPSMVIAPGVKVLDDTCDVVSAVLALSELL